MVAHGLITGMLFFIAGSVKERYHTLEIKRLQRHAAADAASSAGSSASARWPRSACPASPGSGASSRRSSASYNPLHGDGLPFGGLSEALFRTLMVIAALGTVLAAGYLLWLYQRTAFGEVNPEFVGDGHDASAHSRRRRGQRRHDDDDHDDIPDVEHLRVDRLDAAAHRASSCSASTRS